MAPIPEATFLATLSNEFVYSTIVYRQFLLQVFMFNSIS